MPSGPFEPNFMDEQAALDRPGAISQRNGIAPSPEPSPLSASRNRSLRMAYLAAQPEGEASKIDCDAPLPVLRYGKSQPEI
jgi:hypothetical protein